MKQRYVGRCSKCGGEVYGSREVPLQAKGMRPGDSCISCGATVVLDLVVPSAPAPGVETMQDFQRMARQA
jgi:hypothetical protein